MTVEQLLDLLSEGMARTGAGERPRTIDRASVAFSSGPGDALPSGKCASHRGRMARGGGGSPPLAGDRGHSRRSRASMDGRGARVAGRIVEDRLLRPVPPRRRSDSHQLSDEVAHPLAADRLRRTGDPLARIAAEVGYTSDSALVVAFKRLMDEPPRCLLSLRGFASRIGPSRRRGPTELGGEMIKHRAHTCDLDKIGVGD